LFDLALAMVERARPVGARIIVNDRADIARAASADGVHVGQDDLSPAAARLIVGTSAVIGRSTHSAEQWTQALREPIDYLAIGPVFGTSTKETGYEPVGTERVFAASQAAAASGVPVVAIGGITLERAPAVLAAGAQAVAIISDLLSGGNPERRVREYLDRLAG
jgi:thiamine-phosphate pyrophosphorylase